MDTVVRKIINAASICQAGEKLKGIVLHTPLMKNENLSEKYGCNVYLKREDLQVVRSYKIRGAYNLISSLTEKALQKGVVCASAGNHAQGVAYSCRLLNTHGKIFMPYTTPKQKVKQVQLFGKDNVEIILTGDTFDDCFEEAVQYAEVNQMEFVHPFDHPKIIEGQGTVAKEILDDFGGNIDYLFVPVGGGGLASGVGSYFRQVSPLTKIVGVEPFGAPAMQLSLQKNAVTEPEQIDKFVDGAAVKRVGKLTFEICREVLDEMTLVYEGKVCSTILKLYNEEAIVVEPAGALSVAALDEYADRIKGKNVVCVVSGSNNDIDRMQEIKERSLLYEGIKHYFIIRFPQRTGALKEFVNKVLGPSDDITRFEYVKRNHREEGPALVGIELKDKEDYEALVSRMQMGGIVYSEINNNPDLFRYLV